MNTKRLFYDDAYCSEFSAEVCSCCPAEAGYAVILDQTAFYPEGGGQPCDLGWIGDSRVLDVQIIDDEIVHKVDQPIPVGSRILGRIDFERRFDLMQQHSGEHMVSGLVHSGFGLDNVGFHMGSDVITIDFNGELTEEELAGIERRVNEEIWKDREVQIEWPDEETLSTLPYRSKKELTGEVRIVTFPGVDVCACCGMHVHRTGEIGIVRLLSCVRFRGGVRIEMISGRRVLDYLAMVSEQNHRISVLLSAKEAETAAAVERLKAENASLHEALTVLEEEERRLTAKQYEGAGDVLLFRKELSADALRRLTDAIMKSCGGRCAVFSENPDGSYKYAIGQPDGDLRALVKELHQMLGGRGGGKPFFVQGSVPVSKEKIEEFFQRQ